MEAKRFVGIDLGKRTYEIKIIGSGGKVTGTNGLTSPAGRKALYKRLLPTDRVAIEVCSLAMVMAGEMEKEVGCEVVLLNPSQIALIYRSLKKNDKEDALKLARLVQKYENGELPKVELPTEHEENLRQILTELRQLKHDRTREINRIHAVFLECGITEIKRKDLATDEKRTESIKILKGLALIPEKEIIAIDGKTIRRSEYKNHNDESKSHKAAHVVFAFANSMGICFGQVKTEEKSNEITAIPELLELLELKGLIVTIDAMGCQKKIAEKITEKKADYLFSLKGNQEKIHEDVKDFFNHEMDEKYCEQYGIQKLSCAVEKDYGRIEKRDYYLYTNLKWLAEKTGGRISVASAWSEAAG